GVGGGGGWGGGGGRFRGPSAGGRGGGGGPTWRPRYPVTTAMPPSPSSASRDARVPSASIEASMKEARRARSSTGYPVSIISGKTTRRAPRPAARRGPFPIAPPLPPRAPPGGVVLARAVPSVGAVSAPAQTPRPPPPPPP